MLIVIKYIFVILLSFFVIRKFRGRPTCSSVKMLKGYMVRERLGTPDPDASSYCKATNSYCMDLIETCLREACKSKLSDTRERGSTAIVILMPYILFLFTPL